MLGSPLFLVELMTQKMRIEGRPSLGEFLVILSVSSLGSWWVGPVVTRTVHHGM